MNRLTLLLLIVFFGCNSSKNNKSLAGQESKSQQDIESTSVLKGDTVPPVVRTENSGNGTDSFAVKPNTEPIYRFIVSFYSIGEGTEQSQIEKFEAFLLLKRQQSGKKIPAEKTSWGREGEIDYCMDLSELDSTDQQIFIKESIARLNSARWVHFSENSPCRKKRR